MKSVKIICFMLAMLMLFICLAACNSKNNGSEDTTNVTASYDSERDTVKDTVPTDLNFKGESVTFFVRDDDEIWKNEMDVEKTTNDTLFDAIYYRNTTVEERLGVEIKQIGQAGNWHSHNGWNSTLRNAVLTKSGDHARQFENSRASI